MTKKAKLSRNYECPKCGYTFSRNYDLRRHINSVHEIKNIFECRECASSFSQKDVYMEHMENVHKKVARAEDICIAKNIRCFECDKCFKVFGRKDTFLRHLENMHPLKTAIPGIDDKPYFECSKCGIKVRRKDCLKRHIITMHGQCPRVECAGCGCRFKYKNSLIKHIKEHCPTTNTITHKHYGKICAICGKVFPQTSVVIDHYKEAHGVACEREELKFPNIEAFFSWKKNMELSTDTRFRNTHSYNRKTQQISVISFACHRSGFAHIKTVDRLRPLVKESKKLNAVCPAEIRLRRNNVDATCSVSFLKTHLGHDPKSETEFVHLYFRKQKRKMPSRVVIQDPLTKAYFSDVDEDAMMTGPSSRLPERCATVKPVREKANTDFHPNRANVEIFITEYASSILYFNRKRELSDRTISRFQDDDSTTLVFMSCAQKSLLRKHGGDVIALDSIGDVKPGNFILYTMLVLDFDSESLPVAFAISDRMDGLERFLDRVKTAAGTLEPNTLITNMEATYYDSWKRIMGTPKFHLFCSRQVRQAWLSNLKRIEDKRGRSKILRSLRSLSAETDVGVFNKKLSKFIDGDHRGDEVSNFLTYFRAEFVKCTPCWAYCYWTWAGVVMNSRLETFHRCLKRVYDRGRRSTDLHARLTAVARFVLRKLNSLTLRKIYRYETARWKELHRAHERYIAFVTKNENYVKVTKSEDGWLVRLFEISGDERVQEMFMVRRLRETCPAEDCDYEKCDLACIQCGGCAHLYCCTCAENTAKNNMCEHIHALLSTTNKLAPQFVVVPDGENLFAPEFVDTDGNFAPFASSVSSPPIFEVSAPKPEHTDDVQEYREHVCRKLSRIYSSLSNVQNIEQLKCVERLLEAISPVISSVVDSVLPFSNCKKSSKFSIGVEKREKRFSAMSASRTT